MSIDLRGVIARLGTSALPMERRAPGTWDKGAYVPGTVTVSVVQGSWQPAGRSTRELFEGVRADDLYEFYTATALLVASDPDGQLADRLQFGNNWYEVQIVYPWADTGQGAYYKAVAKRLRTVVT